MAKSKSSIDNLKLGRGKRPKLNNITVGMRMSPETKARLEEIAAHYECTYAGKPWIAGLLEKIGSDELVISRTPAYLLGKNSSRCGSSSDDTTQDEKGVNEIDQTFGEYVTQRYNTPSKDESQEVE
ncbi:MAG: hypothetical protein AAF892_05785 [Cyanobacteria bacterium P01_D01_bin.71]